MVGLLIGDRIILDRVESIPYKTGPLQTIARIIRGRPKLTLTRRYGQVFVSDGRRNLALVSEGRVNRYNRGIGVRISKMLRDYHLPAVPLSPGDLVVNVGANIGELVIGCSEQGCRVVAIEPDPAALACLRINVPDATIIEAGLWDEDRDLTFYLRSGSADTSAITSSHKNDKPFTVTARRLDTLLTDDHIRLLVGDAEGAEPEVLAGAENILPRIDYVSIACGPERNGERTVDTCRAFLRARGFAILSDGDYVLARNNTITR